jgi:hypothetical protein
MGTGEDIDVGQCKCRSEPGLVRRIIQGSDVESPAGERFGVAMDNAYDSVTDLIAPEQW